MIELKLLFKRNNVDNLDFKKDRIYPRHCKVKCKSYLFSFRDKLLPQARACIASSHILSSDKQIKYADTSIRKPGAQFPLHKSKRTKNRGGLTLRNLVWRPALPSCISLLSAPHCERAWPAPRWEDDATEAALGKSFPFSPNSWPPLISSTLSRET